MPTLELNNLRLAKDWKGSEEYILKALESSPTSPEYWFCLSEAVGAQNRFDEALRAASIALSYDPLKYQAWTFMANAHAGMGNWDGVRSSAERAMELAPDLPQAHWLLGHCDMASNNWGSAWAHLEYGVLCKMRDTRGVGSKAWKGEECVGKTLMVWSEQGMGDAIQYSRFLSLLKERTGANILFECREPLVEIMRPLTDMVLNEQIDRTVSFNYDYHLPLMDIPRLLGLDTEDISGKPYLTAPGIRDDAKEKVGLVWKGFSGHGNDFNRSIPDELLEKFKGLDLVAIQPGVTVPEWLPNLPVSDFNSTAAVLSSLKCLITVDTSTAHLAGALGVPTIMIAPIKNTEARWAHGETTPWYDSWNIVHSNSFEEAIMKAKSEYGKL